MTANRLNDLTGAEWLPATRSVNIDGVDDPTRAIGWDAADPVIATMTAPGVRDELKTRHPATFSDFDAQRLIRAFTREGQLVLDPFIGSGSTAVAALKERRACIGFELYERWSLIAQERAHNATHLDSIPAVIKTTDALSGLAELPDDSVDFILTSPPYWNILNKGDHKAKAEREDLGLDTNYGADAADISQIESYEDFIAALHPHFLEWRRVLKPKAYAAVIVSDFRHKSRYYMLHADIANSMDVYGLRPEAMIVIVQDNKRLYPYGYPTAYVPNIVCQFAVIARRAKEVLVTP